MPNPAETFAAAEPLRFCGVGAEALQRGAGFKIAVRVEQRTLRREHR
jgi:hypothetical protein